MARWRGLRIAVWGDFVADEFVHGEIARVSREAPVLILKQRSRSVTPGGAGNAAMNLAALGARVAVIGVVGDDETGRAVRDAFRRAGIDTAGLASLRGRGTPTKTRILASQTHTTPQQVIRVDREPEPGLQAALEGQLARRAQALAARGHALLLSDYGYGAVTPARAQAVRAALGADAVITVDSRYRLADYSCGLTAATPNEPELEEIYHLPIGHDQAHLEEAGRALLARLGCRWLLVTRGRDGMALFAPGRATRHVPVYGSDQAVDVTGAGDTVIAAFTAALAAGADGAAAARLANIAGGIVVMKRGTATVSAAELEAACRGGQDGLDRPARGKALKARSKSS